MREIKRKHTGRVQTALTDIQEALELLLQKRDERRDGFYKLMQSAMQTRLGDDAEEVGKTLAKRGINRQLIESALKIAREQGRFTIFALVDALTRLSQNVKFAGDRLAIDQKVSRLLELAL